MLPDYVDPVKTVADVTVEVWDVDGEDIFEVLRFQVEVTGYPDCDADDLEIGKVECLECGLSAETRRQPGNGEGPALVAQFRHMLANEGGRYDGERDQIMTQLREAIEFDSPESQSERANHAAAESRYGGSL